MASPDLDARPFRPVVGQCLLAGRGHTRNATAIAGPPAVPVDRLGRKGFLYAIADAPTEASADAMADAVAVGFYRDDDAVPARGLERSFRWAWRRLGAQPADTPGNAGPGLIAAVVRPDHLVAARIGSGLVCRIRGADLVRLTAEEGAGSHLVDRLERMDDLPSAPGDASPSLQPEIVRIGARPGDRLLLLSGGIGSLVQDAEVVHLVARLGPRRATETIVELARRRGWDDALSSVILTVPPVMDPAFVMAAPARPQARSRATVPPPEQVPPRPPAMPAPRPAEGDRPPEVRPTGRKPAATSAKSGRGSSGAAEKRGRPAISPTEAATTAAVKARARQGAESDQRAGARAPRREAAKRDADALKPEASREPAVSAGEDPKASGAGLRRAGDGPAGMAPVETRPAGANDASPRGAPRSSSLAGLSAAAAYDEPAPFTRTRPVKAPPPRKRPYLPLLTVASAGILLGSLAFAARAAALWGMASPPGETGVSDESPAGANEPASAPIVPLVAAATEAPTSPASPTAASTEPPPPTYTPYPTYTPPPTYTAPAVARLAMTPAPPGGVVTLLEPAGSSALRDCVTFRWTSAEAPRVGERYVLLVCAGAACQPRFAISADPPPVAWNPRDVRGNADLHGGEGAYRWSVAIEGPSGARTISAPREFSWGGGTCGDQPHAGRGPSRPPSKPPEPTVRP